MEKKWNLQDIKPAGRGGVPKRSTEPKVSEASDMRRKATPAPESIREEREERVAEASPRRKQKGRGGKKTTMFLGIGALVILGVGFAASLVFGGAVVEIKPKQKQVTVDADFTAFASAGVDQLPYELLTLEATSERQVTATGKENVSLQAEGTITVYNAASDAPQRLIKNTRFESPDGLIFRIFESIEVPGRTEAADGSVVPGTATARVFADASGEEYNLAPSRFVVPGLRGSDQFEGVYAESKEAFTGGFEGERYIIDDAELTVVKDALHEELEQALRTRLGSERPAGFVVFDNAVTFEFLSLPSTESGNNLATIKEQGKLVVPIFKEDAFASYIARNTVAGYENEPVMIENPGALTFAYRHSGTSTPQSAVSGASSINFALKGDAYIIWKFDEGKLKQDLKGTAKTALPTILGGYPAIEKAEAVIKPFWKKSFPPNTDEITLKTIIGDK